MRLRLTLGNHQVFAKYMQHSCCNSVLHILSQADSVTKHLPINSQLGKPIGYPDGCQTQLQLIRGLLSILYIVCPVHVLLGIARHAPAY